MKMWRNCIVVCCLMLLSALSFAAEPVGIGFNDVTQVSFADVPVDGEAVLLTTIDSKQSVIARVTDNIADDPGGDCVERKPTEPISTGATLAANHSEVPKAANRGTVV
jgi:hypothetical protein